MGNTGFSRLLKVPRRLNGIVMPTPPGYFSRSRATRVITSPVPIARYKARSGIRGGRVSRAHRHIKISPSAESLFFRLVVRNKTVAGM